MANNEILNFVFNAYKRDNTIIKAEIEAVLDIEIEFDFEDYDMTKSSPQYNFIKKVIDDKGIDLIKPIYEKYSITKEMKEALDKIGDTPMKEPILYEAFNSEDEDFLSSAVKDVTGIDGGSESLIAYSIFLVRLRNKVLKLDNEKGLIKITDDTLKVGIIDNDDNKKIRALMDEAGENDRIYSVIYEGIREKYGLDKDVIEWRKELVGEYIYRQMVGAANAGIMGL